MGKITTVEELKDFLRQSIGEEAYEKFVANYENSANPKDEGEDTVEDFLKYFIDLDDFSDVLSTAFVFLYTPEGNSYWENIERIWLEACESL